MFGGGHIWTLPIPQPLPVLLHILIQEEQTEEHCFKKGNNRHLSEKQSYVNRS